METLIRFERKSEINYVDLLFRFEVYLFDLLAVFLVFFLHFIDLFIKVKVL